MEVALAAAGVCLCANLLTAAAGAGHLGMCRWLVGRGCPLAATSLGQIPAYAAAEGGHAEVVEYLLEQGCPWDADLVYGAASYAHVDMMRILQAKRPKGRPHTPKVKAQPLLTRAAAGCDLPTLKGLWKEWRAERETHILGFAVVAAARSPTPDWEAKLAWLLEQGAPRREDACTEAARLPDGLARMALLMDVYGFPCGRGALQSAASSGRAETVTWLLARRDRIRDPETKDLSMTAARLGHVAVLRALHAAGAEMDEPRHVFRVSVVGGVEAAAWVLDTFGDAALEPCSPAMTPFDVSCQEGRLEVVQWVLERGGRPGSGTWAAAAASGCVELLEWLVERGYGPERFCSNPDRLFAAAAARGDLLTLQTLRRLGVPLSTRPQPPAPTRNSPVPGGPGGGPSGPAACTPASSGSGERGVLRDVLLSAPVPALQWLRDAGCTADWAAAAAQVEGFFRRWEAAPRERLLVWLEAQRWLEEEKGRGKEEEEEEEQRG
ncbi:hypothetical protein HYH03_001753 [Edaphochlamys debaryana]|uniref:Uncharacterized protein n=1 Tax=Edaphochlamys debaryana TaxID=47281 RepID=A0A836C4H7_9CHLO|nr:hypothetical protein HYH03_001753 [Edaphochlamys debaryana]|eukprot:KAG2500171.1 hypothetical protein HYH03_001753 [Edaphochlamys debaryana]